MPVAAARVLRRGARVGPRAGLLVLCGTLSACGAGARPSTAHLSLHPAGTRRTAAVVTAPHPTTTSPAPDGARRKAVSPRRAAPAVAIPTRSAHTGRAPRPAHPVLVLGDSGPAVAALQARLTALGYWVGTTDGYFGDSTEQAVYALQKAAGVAVDGAVGPVTAAALARGAVPHPLSRSGRLIEVDLADDLLMFADGGRAQYILNTSTGGGYYYTVGGVTALAETPVGHFTIYRQVDGMVTDSLGELWRPKFFYSGFAIHGDGYVPGIPVSHGCVRVSDEAIDWIWADDLAPIGTPVWIYG